MIRDPASELSSELSSGERLIWSGRPRQGLFLRGSDVFMIPFSLFWGGFAIFWEWGVLSSTRHNHGNSPAHADLIMPLFGIPFVLIGLYLIFGRFFLDKKQRESTVYGITNQRIIIRSGFFARSTKSLNLQTLSDLSLTERSDGSGTITFGPIPPYYSLFAGSSSTWPNYGRYSLPCFDTISEAKQTYDLIRRTQKEIQAA